MVKIIVAYAREERCAQVASILESAGLEVFRHCTSASEIKRALNQCGDGILVVSSKLPDSTVDALAWDLGSKAVILVMGNPNQLELCEHPNLFRLVTPCSKGELTSAVNMLIQLHRMRLPRRSVPDKQIIDKAKEKLGKLKGMTEPEAHRFLQKCAMDSGMKLAEFAAKLLENNES